MAGKQDPNEKIARDARRNIERLSEQSEKLLGARSTAGDDDANDPVVIWGKRLGRGTAYLLGAYLIFHFLQRYGML